MLTDANTRENRTYPTSANILTLSPGNHNFARPSPSTIRLVRTSGVTERVQPFEDTIKTVPHGLPGKKRRRESDKAGDHRDADEDAKENRMLSDMPQVATGWDEVQGMPATEKEEDEGDKRGGKRAKLWRPEPEEEKLEVKRPKPNAMREAAAKNAKERKGNGRSILSL